MIELNPIVHQAFALAAQDYYLALEFAHVTIFFAAIVFVLQAIFLLAITKRIVSKWDKCGAQQLGTLLQEGKRVSQGGNISYSVKLFIRLQCLGLTHPHVVLIPALQT